MLYRIFSSINQLRGIPRHILLSGVCGALCVMLAALCLLFFAPRYGQYVLSCQLCEAAVTIFAEGIVLGLLWDMFFHKTT